MAVDWNYYDRFDVVSDKYLPRRGEGETKATQIMTAVSKLVYKWYNDGDVYDNTHFLNGWLNDLSSYANWLWKNTTPEAAKILEGISDCYKNSDYEDLLKRIADILLDEEYLEHENENVKVGSVYDCDGPFVFEDWEDEDEDDEDWGDGEDW